MPPVSHLSSVAEDAQEPDADSHFVGSLHAGSYHGPATGKLDGKQNDRYKVYNDLSTPMQGRELEDILNLQNLRDK